jgi:thiol-disulfide isomerase/thioredoxin
MRTLIISCLLAASVFGQQKAASSGLIKVDQPGFAKVIAAHKGRVVLASFWATWCVPCRKEMPDLVQLAQRLSARGFDLVMISADEPDREAAALKLLNDNHVPGLLYRLQAANNGKDKDADNDRFYTSVDPHWAEGALPGLFLYDRSGKKVRSFIGETSVKDLEAAITKLL